MQAADFLADEQVLQRLCAALAEGLFPDKVRAERSFLEVIIVADDHIVLIPFVHDIGCAGG